jgi:hypothetical protein
MLLSRLERVSADSYWAHRASGIRGALLNTLDELEREMVVGQTNLTRLVSAGFEILTKAAREKTER